MLRKTFCLFTAFSVFSLLLCALPDRSEAKNGWKLYEDKFYFKIFWEKADFFHAEMNCQKRFSHLASYEGIDDFTFIRELMKSAGTSSQKCWLGLYNRNEFVDKGFYKFYFTDGSEFDSAAWRKFPLYSEHENDGAGHSPKSLSQHFLSSNQKIHCGKLLIHESHISSVSIVRVNCSQQLPAHVCKITSKNYEAHRAQLESMESLAKTSSASSTPSVTTMMRSSTVTSNHPGTSDFSTNSPLSSNANNQTTVFTARRYYITVMKSQIDAYSTSSHTAKSNKLDESQTTIQPKITTVGASDPASTVAPFVSSNAAPFAWVAPDPMNDAQSVSSATTNDCSPETPQACLLACNEITNILARLQCTTGATDTVIVVIIVPILVIIVCSLLVFCCYKHTREKAVYWLNRNKQVSFSEASDSRAGENHYAPEDYA